MKTGDIINDSLRATLDDAGTAKWSDLSLLGFLFYGVRYIQITHPRFRMKSTGALTPPSETTFTTLNDDIPLDVITSAPLRDYVLYQAFATDSGDAADKSRAQTHFDAFLDFFRSTAGQSR